MIVGNEVNNISRALIKQGKEMEWKSLDGFELGSGIICKVAAFGGYTVDLQKCKQEG